MSESEKCPTCGTVKVIFDPPLSLEVVDSCGKIIKLAIYLDGILTRVKTEECINVKDHEDQHYIIIDELVRVKP